MSTRSTNLAHPKIAELIEERADGSAGIRYAANGGGYERNVYFVTRDGGALHIDTVLDQIDEVDFTDTSAPQWCLEGYNVNYENHDLVDDHTGMKIPAAYAA